MMFSTDDLRGKLVMFVNVASKCGFTPQYEALEALNQKYGSRGLTIVGFPTDQFKQELGTESEIQQFCQRLWRDCGRCMCWVVWMNRLCCSC